MFSAFSMSLVIWVLSATLVCVVAGAALLYHRCTVLNERLNEMLDERRNFAEPATARLLAEPAPIKQDITNKYFSEKASIQTKSAVRVDSAQNSEPAEPAENTAEGSDGIDVTLLSASAPQNSISQAEAPQNNTMQADSSVIPPVYNMKSFALLSEMALELSDAGYWSFTSEHNGMIWLSERLVNFTGLPERSDSLYHFEREILPLISMEDPRKATEVRTHVIALQHGEETRFESQHCFRRPTDNAVLWVLFAARAKIDRATGKVSVFGVLQNITRVKLVEMHLAAERSRLQSLFDSSPVGLLIIENNTVYQVNPWLQKLTGIAVGDDPYTYLYGPEVSPEHMHAQLKENAGLVSGVEMFVRDQEKNERVLLTSYSQVLSDGQESILAWFVDMTDIKHAQAAYIAAKESAENAAQAKSRFLANVSHEIRTPMNAIIGLTYLVLQTALTPKQRTDLEKIERSSKALLQLLNDILDVSRIEAGRLELASNEFTLHEVLLNLANLLAMETERKGLELEFRIASGVPGAVRGDALRLGQVLMNITGNAVKFTEKGDILVCVDVERRTEHGIELRFSVRDSGIGISEEKLSHLFEHFTQADASSTRRFGGTGLGLSISKSLVELMGGRILVTSELGKGSTFSFIVPFNLENMQVHDVGKTSPAVRGLRILVVDDTPLARGVVGEYLQRMHFRVDMVENGHRAIDAIQCAAQAGSPYKFVLVDWKMPGMDGLELARRIMFEEELQETPTIFMITAHISGNIFAKAERVGIRRVLLKPVNPSALLDAITDFSAADGDNATAGYTVVGTSQNVSLPAGLRVLLAEDNPINQQVVREVLETVGVRVDIAENGREAVQLVREVAYDLVLMDIQMPIMDGISAVKILRQQPQFTKLPIIAMTAHAMPEDRDKSYAAGMNEHITKPIDPHELFLVIRKWARAEKDAVSPAKAVPLPPALQDLPGINTKSALGRLGGNVQLYLSLLQEYHARYMHLCRMVSQHLDTGELEAAEALFHDFKGTSAALGATTLAQSAGSLEAALHNGKEDAHIRMALNALQVRLDEVMQGLAHLASLTGENSESKELNTETVSAVLREAAKMIEVNSPEASSVLIDVQAQLSARLPREMEKLYVALDNFDFGEARKALSVIIKKLDMELPN